MKSAVSSQQFTVRAFGEGLYCRVLQEGQIVTINLISYITEEITARFSINNLLDVFRKLEAINVPYGIVCMDRRITYA